MIKPHFARPTLLCATLAIGVAGAAAAPPPRNEDPDWPCQQRLMPSLGAASFWTGGPAAEDWRADPEVARLVGEIAPRQIGAEAGVAAIGAFAERIASPDERRRRLPLVFAGLLEETNRERAEVIGRLRDLGHRQHELADLASRAGDELRTIPADATGEAAARRSDLEQRVTFVTQAFEKTQRTMRYACEVPVRLEARLGRYAAALKERL